MNWEERVAALWAAYDQHEATDFLAKIGALVAERPPGDAAALFEHACAQDSTSHEADAEPLYRRALAAGLTGIRRRRATIQLASTLRNLGRAVEGTKLLLPELDAPSDELDDAVKATLALCLVDTGQERKAVSLLLTALVRHLPRYNRSMARYARELIDDGRQ